MKNNQYIKIIIFFSSFTLLGFLIIQFYWAKNTFTERIDNFNNIIEVCVQEIGEELRNKILTNSKYFNPNIQNKKLSLGNKNYNKNNVLDSLAFEINNISEKSITEKRKEIFGIINNHFALNVNINVDNSLKKKEILSLCNDILSKHAIENEFHFSITDKSGLLIESNFENIDNAILTQSNSYSVEFLKDDLFTEKRIFTLYILKLEKSVKRSFSHILIISIILILIILGTFIYSIKIIQDQEKTTQIKTDFINNMTHELKTPIATIGLACEALSDSSIKLEKKNKQKFLSTIKSENERLGKLVENVLQSSLSQKGNPDLKLEVFNVEEVITKAIRSINLSFNKKKGEIKTDFLAKNILMEADKLHITNVFYNLLDNSQKYCINSPVVTISTRDVIGGVIIRIKDNGIGIARDNHKRIFEKLYRVPTGDLHNVKGFGLGLSYVKTIIDLHKGKIMVESKINSGSVFSINLKSSKILS
ncbi:HAMP domain-containing histidine kinase [Flavobacteriales bacterium]|nr:HAMP domain-containing histidine kinase [Flavobacteriales bacterium]